jgi:hypothetical protein
LRELRPGAEGAGGGQSIAGSMRRLFTILAIGPEAEIDKAGYAKAVRLAKQRLKRLEKAKGEGVVWVTITSLLSEVRG